MDIKTPYFLHMLRYLFFIVCMVASITMFYRGFSPFRYVFQAKTRASKICETGSGIDPECDNASYNKVIVVTVDGWNNMMADYLGFDNVTEIMPFLDETFEKQQELDELDETTLYLNLNLDKSTSPSAISKTILVGNLPGLIEIPKQLFFNSTYQVDLGNSTKQPAVINLDEDDLLYRNKIAEKGLAVSVGKTIVQKNLREKFNLTFPEMGIDDLLDYVYENPNIGQEYRYYDEEEDEDDERMNEISLLMVNYKVRVGQAKKDIKERFMDISDEINLIMETMNKNTVLIVTGNKAFENNFSDRVGPDFRSTKNIRNNRDDVLNPNKPSPYSGLFMYTKRQSNIKYDYHTDETMELYATCPNKKIADRVSSTKSEMIFDKYGSVSNPHSGVPVFLNFMNTFDTSLDLIEPDTTHILNLTSTISSLLGISIPFSNIGTIIPHSYIFEKHDYCVNFYKSITLKYLNNLRQILEYKERYYHGHKTSEHVIDSEDDVTLDEQAQLDILEGINTDMAQLQKGYEKYVKVEARLVHYLNQKAKFNNGPNRNLDQEDALAGNTTVTDDNDGNELSDQEKAELEKNNSTNSDGHAKTEPIDLYQNILNLKPTEQELRDLNNYILKYEKTVKKIYDHLQFLSDSIKEDQKSVDITKFEIAIVVLFLLLSVLCIRVFAFIFEDRDNYKRLPTVAKLERDDNERRPNKYRNLYVASNPQIILFSLIALGACLFVYQFTFISCMIFMSYIVYKILEMLMVLTRQTHVKSRINKKRKVISIASFVVGAIYVFSQYDRDFVQSYDTKLTFIVTCIYFIVLGLNLYVKKIEYCSIQNVFISTVCLVVIRLNDVSRALVRYNHWYMPKFIQSFLTSGVVNYSSMIAITALSYYMVRVMRRFGPTTRPIMVKIYGAKNLVCFVCLIMHWGKVRSQFKSYFPPAALSAEIIYLSTLAIFVVQVIGLFSPNITSEVYPNVEKEFPLKRIKEHMFFMLFNALHVFILVGGPTVAPQYLLMFLQIFTFFEMCSEVRIYNSLVTSLFTILTALQYFLATGHGFEASSLQTHTAKIGIEALDRRLVTFFIYFSAYAPVIFCISWSLQMVIKQQDGDEKLSNMILDMSKDEENSAKDIIVLRKKISLNLIHEFCLRCLFFLYAAYMSSMLLTARVLILQTGEKEYVTNKFFFDTLFVLVASGSTLFFILFLSFA